MPCTNRGTRIGYVSGSQNACCDLVELGVDVPLLHFQERFGPFIGALPENEKREIIVH